MRIEVDFPKIDSETYILPFMTSGLQIYHIIEWVVRQIGPCELVNTTFSVAEEFLRSIFRLKKEGLIISAVEVADLKSAAKTQKINDLLRAVFDKVYLGENHSKVVLLSNERYRISIVTSQNQTRGNRTEAGIITANIAVFDMYKSSINNLINKSIQWNKGEALPTSIKK